MLMRILRMATVGLGVCTLVPAVEVQAQAGTLVAIVNRNRPETGLTKHEIARIFRGEMRYWPANRQLIQLAVSTQTTAASDKFIRQVLETTPDDWAREWRGKRFRGEAPMIPTELSRGEVMQAVTNYRHFIAIVELDYLRNLDTRDIQNLKILQIDGKSPEQPDYPLRLGLLRLPTDPLLAVVQWAADLIMGDRAAIGAAAAR